MYCSFAELWVKCVLQACVVQWRLLRGAASVLPARPATAAVRVRLSTLLLLSAQVQCCLSEQRYLCVALLQADGERLLCVSQEGARLG